jgi:hypothetical protein
MEKPKGDRHEFDEHIGAVEGDRPTDRPQQGNPNDGRLDEDGLPTDRDAICEDVIGANTDRTTG